MGVPHAPLLGTTSTGTVTLSAAPFTTIAAPAEPAVPAVATIGTDVWKSIPTEQRLRSVRSLYDTVSTNGLKASGVSGMLRLYLRAIAPLERMGGKRGHEWRSTRYAGRSLMQSFSDLLNKSYVPILCRLLELSDDMGGDSNIWAAACVIEEERSTWEELVKMDAVKRFAGKGFGNVKNQLLARLQSVDFATAAFQSLTAVNTDSNGDTALDAAPGPHVKRRKKDDPKTSSPDVNVSGSSKRPRLGGTQSH